MSYFVVVTFDIANGRFEDYEGIYEDFAALGLTRTLQSKQGKTVRLPTTTTAGEFNGQSVGRPGLPLQPDATVLCAS
jgi:hypothetical protein